MHLALHFDDCLLKNVFDERSDTFGISIPMHLRPKSLPFCLEAQRLENDLNTVIALDAFDLVFKRDYL